MSNQKRVVKYYGYLRVSTETQAEKGGGLNMQRRAIEQHAARLGVEISAFFSDAGISGAAKDTDGEEEAIAQRKGLLQMLATAKAGDAIIVKNTNRLWRSDVTKVIIRREMKRRGVKLISIDQPSYNLYNDNPNDRLMETMFEALDEWDRGCLTQKLAAGRAAKASDGNKPAGVLAYGYKYSADKKSVVVDADEAQLVERMFMESLRGRSLKQIAADLNKDGYQTRRGKAWSHNSVRAILHNKFYTGKLCINGKYIEGNHEPLISAVVFGKVQAGLKRKEPVQMSFSTQKVVEAGLQALKGMDAQAKQSPISKAYREILDAK